jgi:imidazoleglycerol-phosphate dehydratase/histidinol-phosphatase
MVRHFFASLAQSLGAALHLEVRGENTHHMVEALFKGLGRALRPALARQGSDLPSTKGRL